MSAMLLFPGFMPPIADRTLVEIDPRHKHVKSQLNSLLFYFTTTNSSRCISCQRVDLVTLVQCQAFLTYLSVPS
jgi:hypothetical protein